MENTDKNTEMSQSCKNAVMVSASRLEYIAEELKLCMGFNVEVFQENRIWKLKMNTIAGLYVYIPDSKQTIMFDVYRFISNYGVKLHKWGLTAKINEYEKTN